MEITRKYIEDIKSAYLYNSASTSDLADRKLKELINILNSGESLIIEEENLSIKTVEEFITWNQKNGLLNNISAFISLSPLELFKNFSSALNSGEMNFKLDNESKNAFITNNNTNFRISFIGVAYINKIPKTINNINYRIRFSYLDEFSNKEKFERDFIYLTIENLKEKEMSIYVKCKSITN